MPSGQKILHHRSDVLETVVLINPSDEAVSTEVSIRFWEVLEPQRMEALLIRGARQVAELQRDVQGSQVPGFLVAQSLLLCIQYHNTSSPEASFK